MDKKLNTKRIVIAMAEQGLSQAKLAQVLGVSRTIVSSWMQGAKVPRPDKMLQLGVTLGLPFQELVETNIEVMEPVVAFRKKGNRKTKAVHLEKAKEMGQLLESLVPHLQMERIFQPAVLKTPRNAYPYVQKAAARIREEMGLSKEQNVDFRQLIEKLKAFEVVLIPVFHGSREYHENALHIFLPASRTTWIYLNLDVHLHDFKFWMAHELGHVLAPGLSEDIAEDFADTFAQALLFPESEAETAFGQLKRLATETGQIERIIHLAEKRVISPVTVYRAVNAYAAEYGLTGLELEPSLYAATYRFNDRAPKVAEKLGMGTIFSASDYIAMASTVFGSPFFSALKSLLAKDSKSAGFVQAILDIPMVDAKEIYSELTE